MRVVYLDCVHGITGEALLGALIDVGIDHNEIIKEIKRVINDGFQIIFYKDNNPKFSATRVVLNMHPKEQCINNMTLSAETISRYTKDQVIGRGLNNIIKRFERARAKLFKDPAQDVVDLRNAIITVGTLAAINKLFPCKIIAAPLPLNTIISNDDKIVNNQLILEMATGVTIKPSDDNFIVNSPLGIALLAELTDEYGPLPEITLEKVGYGTTGGIKTKAGEIFRVLVGQSPLYNHVDKNTERVITVQTSIDDMNPEIHPYLIEKLFEAGALDVYLIPIMMKKGRLGNLLTAICKYETYKDIAGVIFRESTTLGIRLREEKRIVAGRRLENVDTIYGNIQVKISYLDCHDTPIQIAPEYEDCKKRALENGVPIKEVYAAACFEIAKKYQNVSRETF